MSVIGAELDRPFDSAFAGPYQVDLCFQNQKDLKWIAFDLKAFNTDAIVTVERHHVNSATGRSPYFIVQLGETKTFRIAVSTTANKVEEEYFVTIQRCAHHSETVPWAKSWADFLGYGSSMVSAVSGPTFVQNSNFLHWLSFTNRLNGNPETYSYFTDALNKFNLQFDTDCSKFKQYSWEKNETFHYPPEHYGHLINIKNQQGYTFDHLVDDMAREFRVVGGKFDGMDGPSYRKAVSRATTSLFGIFDSKEDMRDRVTSLSPEDKMTMLRNLDAEATVHHKMLQFAQTLLTCTVLLSVAAVSYVLVWAFYLKEGSMATLRQDFPLVLHPTKFWTVILDFAMITYVQGTVGFISLLNKDVTMNIGPFNDITPWKMLAFNIIGLVGFPLLYLAAGAVLLSRVRGENVWSTVFNSHHDALCFETKARKTTFKWLPVLSNFFTVEVRSVAPLSCANDSPREPSLIFVDESKTLAPWDSSDPEVAKDYSRRETGDIESGRHVGYQALTTEHAAAMRFDSATDRLQVSIDDARYMEHLYDLRNVEIQKRVPEAMVGYNTFHMKNGYDVQVDLDVEIQLRHLGPILESSNESYNLWVPRSHLQMASLDQLGNLYATSQRSNFFTWVVDRLSMVCLIVVTSSWQDTNGFIQMCIAGGLSVALASFHMAGAVSSGVGKWHKLMVDEKIKAEKDVAVQAADAKDADVWPFHNSEVLEHFMELRRRKGDKRWCGSYGLYRRWVKEPIINFINMPFWKTRSAVTLHEVVFGPVFVEICKASIMLSAILGNRSVNMYGNRFASFWTISMSVVAAAALNKDSIVKFAKQCVSLGYEMFIWSRRALLYVADWIHGFACPNFIRVRDFTVWDVKFIQNEFGIQSPGQVSVAKTEKSNYCGSSLIDKRRYHLHKTLYKLGSVSAFREEIDRSMPICMPLVGMFNQNGSELISRAIGTIQIVNHTSQRYSAKGACDGVLNKSTFKHNSDDDSYLTLFTDPAYVPATGDISVKEGHGYSVRYDVDLDQMTIKGPQIAPNKTYKIRSGHKIEVVASPTSKWTTPRSVASRTGSNGTHGVAKEICTDAGVLAVRIPPQDAPSLIHPISIRSPVGHEVHVDPNSVQVVYDPHMNTLHLRSRCLLPSRDQYTITWQIKKNEVMVDTTVFSTAAGTLVVPMQKGAVPALDHYIMVSDNEGEIVIDPSETDKYQVQLPPPQYTGFVKILHAIWCYVANLWCFIVGRDVVQEHTAVPISCTIVQCTNPIDKMFRVEPNFDAAIKAVAAKVEETHAKLDTLDDPAQLGVVCFSVMTSGEFAQFFRSHGLEIQTEDRWINPLLDVTHPLFRDKVKIIREIEPKLRQEVEKRLHVRSKMLDIETDQLMLWKKAYNSSILYEAQLERDVGDYNDETDALIDERIKKVRALKKEHENQILGFVYPFTVHAKHISKKANCEAQMALWRLQVKQWLIQEENANRGSVIRNGNTHYECILHDVLRALSYTFYRQEQVEKGAFKSMLHMVCNSATVRGHDFLWRPDPISAHPAWVRLWAKGDDGRPLYNEPPVWLPCSLKLSGTSIKMLMPHIEDASRPFYTPHEWKHVTGFYVPLAAFQKVDLTQESPAPADCHPYMKTTDTELVFRKNQQVYVDDNYVRRVEDDLFLNLVHYINRSDEQKKSALIMIGHTVGGTEAKAMWSDKEVDRSIIAEDVNVHPLTFRFAGVHAARWLSAIEANRLANAPDLDPEFDGKTRDHEDTESVESDPSYTETEETEETESDYEPPVVEMPNYQGTWGNNRYHGKGVLKDHDGNVIYDGEWLNGMRWGMGKAWFTDKNNVKWYYEGAFVEDEPSGEGLLIMNDAREAERFRNASIADERKRVVAFKGKFSKPMTVHKVESYPVTHSKPKIHNSNLMDLFSTEVQNSGQLTFEIRRTISAPDDLQILGMDVHSVARNTADANGMVADNDIAYRSKWLRCVDPNAGYTSLTTRMSHGKATFADGSVYEGDLQDAVPHGKGYIQCLRCPMKYVGEWHQGRPYGNGVMEWGEGDSKATHHGQWRDGRRCGAGVTLCQNKKLFLQGLFDEDKLTGGMCTIDIDESIISAKHPFKQYQGNMLNGLPEGEGKLIWVDGAFYVGSFSRGLRHGQGTHHDKNGNVVTVGSWEADLPNGRVTRMVLPTGHLYSGDCIRGQRQGMGELFSSSQGGSILYEGLWLNDLPSGRGTLFAQDGIYDGEWKNGKRHGKGSFVFKTNPIPNGKSRVYDGDWDNDVITGVGMYLNDVGVRNTYQFVNGEVVQSSLKAYKPTCGSLPAQGVAPSVQESVVKAVEPEHWGKRRTIAVHLIKPLTETGGGAWTLHEAKEFRYCAAMDAPPLGPRPDTTIPIGPGGAGQIGQIMSVKVHRATDLPIPRGIAAINPYVKVKSMNRTKRTDSNKGTTNPVWDSTLKFYHRGTESINFEVWSANATREDDLIASGDYKVSSSFSDIITESVKLMRNGKPAGVLAFTLGVSDQGEHISHGEVSSTSAVPRHCPSMSLHSDAVEMNGPQVRISVHSASNLTNVQRRGHQDSYVTLKCGKYAHRTLVKKDGGLNPQFDESFVLAYEEQGEVTFEVRTVDASQTDPLLGSGSVKLDASTNFSGSLKLVQDKDHHAGFLQVSIRVIQ